MASNSSSNRASSTTGSPTKPAGRTGRAGADFNIAYAKVQQMDEAIAESRTHGLDQDVMDALVALSKCAHNEMAMGRYVDAVVMAAATMELLEAQ
jgi:hypothetical protein